MSMSQTPAVNAPQSGMTSLLSPVSAVEFWTNLNANAWRGACEAAGLWVSAAEAWNDALVGILRSGAQGPSIEAASGALGDWVNFWGIAEAEHLRSAGLKSPLLKD